MKPAFWLLLIAALLCTIVGAAPLVVSGTAQAIADAHGCRLDEGSAHVCRVAGSDWGGTLYAMGVMGWLSLVTIWLLLLAVPIWIAWFVVVVVRIVQRANRTASPAQPGAVR